MRPTIGVVTTNTNSYSRGYLGFFACVESWGSLADDLVVVDGGTNDDTYIHLDRFLRNGKYRIIRNESTSWLDTEFHAGQWGINNKIGLDSMSTDWVIIVPGDHILDSTNFDNIYKELEDKSSELILRFARKRIFYGQILEDYKFYAINLKKCRIDGVNLGWGFVINGKQLPDDPIYINCQSNFLDPITSAEKVFFAGDICKIEGRMNSISCWSLGFYFFTKDQAYAHIYNFYMNFNFRFFARPIPLRKHLLYSEGLDGKCKYKWRSLSQFPIVLRDLVDFFRPPLEIIGNSFPETFITSHRNIPVFYRLIYGSIRCKNQFLGFKGIQDLHSWVPFGQNNNPLNIGDIYKKQNHYK